MARPFQEAFQELEAEGLGDCPGSWEEATQDPDRTMRNWRNNWENYRRQIKWSTTFLFLMFLLVLVFLLILNSVLFFCFILIILANINFLCWSWSLNNMETIISSTNQFTLFVRTYHKSSWLVNIPFMLWNRFSRSPKWCSAKPILIVGFTQVLIFLIHPKNGINNDAMMHIVCIGDSTTNQNSICSGFQEITPKSPYGNCLIYRADLY